MTTRLGGVRAHIDRIPTGLGWVLAGELRDNQDQPLQTCRRNRRWEGGLQTIPPIVRLGADTYAGLAALLTALDRDARNKTLHPVADRQAS
jgi:hypothetical protein